jgi:hypothetical protein
MEDFHPPPGHPVWEDIPSWDWMLLLAMAYVVVLHLSPRQRTLWFGDYWGWGLATIPWVVLGRLGYIALTWAFSVAFGFSLSLLLRDRVIHGSRRQDLWWYGLWLAAIVVGSVVWEIRYVIEQGWWGVYWPTRIVEAKFEYLTLCGMILFVEFAFVLRRDDRRGYWRRTGGAVSVPSNS